MAFDGLIVSNIVKELRDKLIGGRITKISQPERDELILTIKNYDTYKLFMSAGASLPLIYLTDASKSNPITAPAFCMLLRKHFNSARILDIFQPDFERIVRIKIEHLNEMGDLCIKYLIVELMGKHSNIILCDDNDIIIDSIKRINSVVSSVREVLPGRSYFVPKTVDKLNPLNVDKGSFVTKLLSAPISIGKALYSSITGLSPLVSNELCHRANIDSDISTAALSAADTDSLWSCFEELMKPISNGCFVPNIIFKGNEPVEFSCVELSSYNDFPDYNSVKYDSISVLLEKYYAEKNQLTRIKQKSVDLRKIVSTAVERTHKKYQLQLKQLEDTEKRDKYRVYGELINTYGYGLEEGAKSLEALNYYDGNTITIPLDPDFTPSENAKRYFDKYSKLKRTYEVTTRFIEETREELLHLDSIQTSLDMALHEEDLQQLRDELYEYGYIKKRVQSAKKQKVLSKPYHYITEDGYHIYVGKNNYQNDELTFKLATGNDWWFHAKGVPGSHVILKNTNTEEIPDKVYETAAALAAYYSKSRNNDRVEIDYLQKKNVKKPNGSKPGFVVYYTNYSMLARPSLDNCTLA